MMEKKLLEKRGWYIVRYIGANPIYFTGDFKTDDVKPEFSATVSDGKLYLTKEDAEYDAEVFGISNNSTIEEHIQTPSK